MNKIMTFNSKIATKLGLNAAVVFQYIGEKVRDNKCNPDSYHDDRIWFKATISEMNEDLPYISCHSISKAIKTLEENDLVISKNLNKQCNRTMSYTFTDNATYILNNTLRFNTKK